MKPILPLTAAAMLLGTAGAWPAAAQAPASVQGTWDLFWQSRKGPAKKSGFLVMRPDGNRLTAELHGRGMVKVRGSVSGNSFQLSGTRMLVRYTIAGTWAGDRMDGAFKVLNTELKFTATRRR